MRASGSNPSQVRLGVLIELNGSSLPTADGQLRGSDAVARTAYPGPCDLIDFRDWSTTAGPDTPT